jgi:predicted nucleotidyltransferase
MTSFSNLYTVDENRPLDPATLHILSVVNRVATELELPYILVGATARDLLLSHVFGFHVSRATADVDFAFMVDSWETFRKLKAALVATGHFQESRVEHRVYLRTPSRTEPIPVDLIPFGKLAEAGAVRWPPAGETVMTVDGFHDALAAAIQARVNEDLIIPVASLAGIAVLKLFAWHDRQMSGKDAIDLYLLLTNYADAGNEDRLYDQQPEFLERVNHDVGLAGAALLASDVRQICSPGTLQKLHELLAVPEFVERLAGQIRLVRWSLRPEMHPRILLVLHSFIEELMR